MEGEIEANRKVTCGLLLAGGRSVRMGVPKALLKFGDEYVLQRIVDVLSEACDSVRVVAAPGQVLPPLPSWVEVVRDTVEGLGPLNGFATGLSALPEGTERVFLTSCDAPFLKPAFVLCVVDRLGSHDLALAQIDGWLHPLAAAYRVRGLHDRVQQLLKCGKRRLLDLLEGADVRSVSAEELREVDPNLDSLFNVNTPEDYETALRMAAMP